MADVVTMLTVFLRGKRRANSHPTHFVQEPSLQKEKKTQKFPLIPIITQSHITHHKLELPKGEDQNEWLAVNTVDFFNEISLLYGTISDFCTRESCPRMTAGEEYEYLWMDGVKYKKPTEVSAPEYVELLMAWVEAQINDEQIFPLQLGTPFPKDFMSRVKKIFQRLFRVYAHVYLSHVDRVSELGAGAHLNTCFKHFIFFVKEFKLIEEPQLEPLKEHITQLTKPQDASK